MHAMPISSVSFKEKRYVFTELLLSLMLLVATLPITN